MTAPVALDDDETSRLDALVGGEPGRAGGALAAPADRRGVVEVPRVDDPGLSFTAMRAAHRPSWLGRTTTACGVGSGYHYIRCRGRQNQAERLDGVWRDGSTATSAAAAAPWRATASRAWRTLR